MREVESLLSSAKNRDKNTFLGLKKRFTLEENDRIYPAGISRVPGTVLGIRDTEIEGRMPSVQREKRVSEFLKYSEESPCSSSLKSF